MNGIYPLVNKQLDPENQMFLVETSSFQARKMAGSMLIYWRFLAGKIICKWAIFQFAMLITRW